MTVHFPKRTALTFFCFFREAERSVHYALSCPSRWPQFAAYYDIHRQAQVEELIRFLKQTGAVQESLPRGQSLARGGWIGQIWLGSLGRFINRFKGSWSFSMREISFFAGTLERMLSTVGNVDPPNKDELINLRLDCFHCYYLIGRKMVGVPEIRIADSIEHFGQSESVSHVSWQEMGIFDLARLNGVSGRTTHPEAR